MEISVQNANLTYDLGIEQGFELIAKAGFTAIDWCLDKAWDRKDIKAGKIPQSTVFNQPLDKIIEYFQPEITAMHKYGLHPTQAHAVFPAYSKGNPDFTDFCIDIYKNTLKLCGYAGCKRLVIHGISRAFDDNMVTDSQLFDLNLHMYSSLIPTAKETGVMILLENLFTSFKKTVLAGTCSDPHEAIEYIDTLNSIAGQECFGLCLDTGHLNLLHLPQQKYIETVGSRIKALHIHDNMMQNDDHLMPYAGNINWNEFCLALKNIKYTGDLSFETFAQVNLSRIEQPLILPFLHAVYACGSLFRDKITQ